jgi:hypothetical protein
LLETTNNALAEQRRAAEQALVKARRAARSPRLGASAEAAFLDLLEALRLTLEYAHAVELSGAKAKSTKSMN